MLSRPSGVMNRGHGDRYLFCKELNNFQANLILHHQTDQGQWLSKPICHHPSPLDLPSVIESHTAADATTPHSTASWPRKLRKAYARAAAALSLVHSSAKARGGRWR